MAYMNQDKKKRIVEKAKPILAKHGVKGTFSVRNSSTLVLTIVSGTIDFAKEYKGPSSLSYCNVNVYHYHNGWGGKALDFLSEIVPVLNDGNHDRSDLMSDYHDVGWYVDVCFGEKYEVKP